MTRPRHKSNPSKENDSGKTSPAQTFATDKEISNWRTAGASAKSPRELAKWTPEGREEAKAGHDFENEARLGMSWDQFEVNQKLFGVTTSFDETIYTTNIDRNAPDFKERESKASKIAKEISEGSGGVTTNLHLAEERGLIVGADYDEEDRYGAVIRPEEAADQLSSVQLPPKNQRNATNIAGGGRRKSITNVNADSEALEAAKLTVSQASATVTRRLSQISESDLNTILTDGKSAKPAAKETKLNPDAAEFVPSFDAPPAQPSYQSYGYGNNTGGYYQQQQQGYYGPSQGGYYADPYYSGYGYSSMYYPPSGDYQQQPGYYAPNYQGGGTGGYPAAGGEPPKQDQQPDQQ